MRLSVLANKSMDYWRRLSRSDVELKITELEKELQLARSRLKEAKDVAPQRSSLTYSPRRRVALLFSYEGWHFSGLMHMGRNHAKSVPIGHKPSVEDHLLTALEETKLIDTARSSPAFGCGFERCGRTDAGVSSSGQVVSLFLRSQVLTQSDLDDGGRALTESMKGVSIPADDGSFENNPVKTAQEGLWKPQTSEISYISMINQRLPSSIRIHAWAPIGPDFSARSSCLWRHYKYFFSPSLDDIVRQPPVDFGSGVAAPELAQKWAKLAYNLDTTGYSLDVEKMQRACSHLVGEHDFRNFCKVDASKQLPTHRRRVISASIDPVDSSAQMYVLNLRGRAFLYHQVRHIVAILFLIGAGLEDISVIDHLFYTSDMPDEEIQNNSWMANAKENNVPPFDNQASYEMASDTPLVLYQCGFSSEDVEWRIDFEPRASDGILSHDHIVAFTGHTPKPPQKTPLADYQANLTTLQQQFMEHQIKAETAFLHLSAALQSGASSLEYLDRNRLLPPAVTSNSVRVPLGAGSSRIFTKYTPIKDRPRGHSPEQANAHWASTEKGRRLLDQRLSNKKESDAFYKKRVAEREKVLSRENK